MELKIYSDGAINDGPTRTQFRIGQGNARELFKVNDPDFPRVDVSQVWGLSILTETVAALIEGSDLPEGIITGERRDGMKYVRPRNRLDFMAS